MQTGGDESTSCRQHFAKSFSGGGGHAYSYRWMGGSSSSSSFGLDPTFISPLPLEREGGL